MRKFGLVLAAALTLTLTCGNIQVHAENTSADYQVIYRMFNPKTGEHFYTSSAEERLHLYYSGWNAEGIGWIAPLKSENTMPVYRLYNPSLGDHHYTVSDEERAQCLANGWNDEGILCQALKSSEGAMTLYRAFLPNVAVGAHHYTTSAEEVSQIVAEKGWNDEGVAWNALNVDFSTVSIPELPDKPSIENIPSYATIEADVRLNGGGTGNHAKLVFMTSTSAVSWGIQYDVEAEGPYAKHTSYLVENVAHNGKGGQIYTHYGMLGSNEWHHMMMTYQTDGTVDFYVDYKYIGSQKNESLANSGTLFCAVEGAARKDGDSVDAEFANIRIKGGGVYDPDRGFNHYDHDRDNGLTVDTSQFVWSTGYVRVAGVMTGLNGRDWDSGYEHASDVVVFSNGL